MCDIWIIIKAKKFQLFTGDIDQIMVKSHVLTKKNIEDWLVGGIYILIKNKSFSKRTSLLTNKTVNSKVAII